MLFAEVESDGQRALFLPVVVQRAADEHHLVGGGAAPGPQRLPEDPQSFDRRQRVFHQHTRPCQLPVRSLSDFFQRRSGIVE